MTVWRRAIPFVCALAIFAAVSIAAAGASTPSAATASKKAKGKSKCPKGKKLVTVKKNGKTVKVCKKKKTPPPPPPPPPPDYRVFPAPGRVLEGTEATTYLQPYLPNSTFTDCVTGWPSCGGFEDRYSHATDNTFYKCLLRPTSGSDVKSVGEYGVAKAKIEPDGSWYVQDVIYWYGYYSYYEWHSTYTGVIEGAYQSRQGETPEKIGPLQYVKGIAKDCSY